MTEAPFGISVALAQSFVDSRLGMRLAESFKPGTLHRGNFHVVAAWQQKFAPVPRKRTRKHRRK
jgi:hypothetical protein